MAAEEPHYETLCTVIQGDDPGWQAFSQRTLHNIPLRIITIRGFHARVTEPMTDRNQVDTRSQKVDGGAVPTGVGMDALGGQSGRCRARSLAVLAHQVPDRQSHVIGRFR